VTRLPKGWVATTLDALASKVGSGATPLGGETAYKPNGVPLIRSMNVHMGTFVRDGLAFIDDAQAARLEGVQVSKEDVLLNITGASIGRVTVVPADLAGARVNQHVCIVRSNGAVDPWFLARFLASPQMQRLINDEQQGATRQALTKAMIQQFEIPLAPLAEQRRIVAKLDVLFARSRVAKASLERMPALIKRLQQAILAAAFRGDLTQTFRTDASRRRGVVRATPEASDYRAPRASKSPHASSAPASQLPLGWSQLPLAQAAEIQVGYAFKSDEFTSHGIRLLRGINILPGAMRWNEVAHLSETSASAYGRYRLNVGDIVLAMDRPIIASGLKVTRLTAADCPALLVQRVARITGRTGVLTDFLFSFLQSSSFIDHLSDQATGTQLPHVSASDIGAALVPVPPLDEQQEIVRQLAHADEVLVRLRHSIHASQVRADLLERAALAAAFRGELVPQDPNDEPASVLLERIRAEREATQPVKSKRGASPSAPTRARSSKAAP
jgi:type I restriction enzyme S subunit